MDQGDGAPLARLAAAALAIVLLSTALLVLMRVWG